MGVSEERGKKTSTLQLLCHPAPFSFTPSLPPLLSRPRSTASSSPQPPYPILIPHLGPPCLLPPQPSNELGGTIQLLLTQVDVKHQLLLPSL